MKRHSYAKDLQNALSFFFPNFTKPLILHRSEDLGPTNTILFLDADGVLWNNEKTLFEGARLSKKQQSILEKLRQKFGRIYIVSNQTGPARSTLNPYYSHLKLHMRAKKLLNKYRFLSGIFLCVHHPHATNRKYRHSCDCRKPKSGLFSYAEDLPLCIENSVMVGDRITDAMAAVSAGVYNNFLIRNDEMLQINENDSSALSSPLFKISGSLREFLDQMTDFGGTSVANSMQILYLSAGRGTRLLPLTETTPKPLLSIGSESILARLIGQFSTHFPHAKHVVNFSNYGEAFFADIIDKTNFRDAYFHFEKYPLGSAGTLLSLIKQSFLPTLVVHGDLVLSHHGVLNLARHIVPDANSFLVSHTREWNVARSQIYSESGKIVKFINAKPLVKGEYDVNSGIYFFSKRDLGLLPNIIKNEVADIPDVFLPKMAECGTLDIMKWQGDRFSIDSLEVLQQARRYVSFEAKIQ